MNGIAKGLLFGSGNGFGMLFHLPWKKVCTSSKNYVAKTENMCYNSQRAATYEDFTVDLHWISSVFSQKLFVRTAFEKAHKLEGSKENAISIFKKCGCASAIGNS